MRRIVTLSLLGLLVLATLSYTFSYYTRPALSEQLRKQAPGSFVELSKGSTHYELKGPEDAPLVVLIHGMSTPLIVWDRTIDALMDAGFRVLRYDLYGRGYSDRVADPYDYALFDKQLTALLDSLGLKEPAHLVGLSMGSATAVIFAAQRPKRVRSLTLLAPLSLPEGQQGWEIALFRAPLVGDWLAELFGERFILQGTAAEIEDQALAARLLEDLTPQMHIRGTAGAILDTARRIPEGPRMAAYKRVAQGHLPVLIIWGTEDQTLPFEMSSELRAMIPRADFLAVPGAGHAPHYERPDLVNPRLTQFLKSHSE